MAEPIVYSNFEEMYSVLRHRGAYAELKKATKKSKITCKLIDAIDEMQVLNLPLKNEQGKRVYKAVKFEPNVTYAIPKDDVVLLEAIKSRGMVKKAYTRSFEEKLKESGVKYEVANCKSCGGRVTKIEYNRIEVKGDE